jgi:hypothetical protein
MAFFDFKSGYHHVDIEEEFQTYLSFSWPYQGQQAYFVFTVLPFGLCSAPFCFTKLFRPLIRRWGAMGFLVFLYLDDGLIIAPGREACETAVDWLSVDLSAAGVCKTKEKCVWSPTQVITWLGVSIELDNFSLSVTEKRLASAERSLQRLYKASSAGKSPISDKKKNGLATILE